jgi:hypothetical protein
MIFIGVDVGGALTGVIRTKYVRYRWCDQIIHALPCIQAQKDRAYDGGVLHQHCPWSGGGRGLMRRSARATNSSAWVIYRDASCGVTVVLPLP